MADLEMVSAVDWARDLFKPLSKKAPGLWWEPLQGVQPFAGLRICRPLWDNLLGTESGMIHGPDVSCVQGEVDWASLRGATGASFAFAKATEGEGYLDPSFKENWAQMAREGLVRGAYHVAQTPAIDRKLPKVGRLDQVAHNAHLEASWFADTVYGDSEPQPGDLPLVLYLDGSEKFRDVKSSEMCAYCAEFSRTIAVRTRRKPIVYVGPRFWRYKLGKSLDLNDHILWLVDGYKSPAGFPEMVIPGWDWAFHQYTNKRFRPDGRRVGEMSWNVFRGRRADLAQLAGVALSASY